MIRVSVMYPTGEDKQFDYDYDAKKHMGMVRERWGGLGLVKVVCFDSLDNVQKASKAHGQELFADVPNFTSITPQVQISEVILPS